MLLEGREYVAGLRSLLVVLGLVDPADYAASISEDCRGDRESRKARRPGMHFLIS
jgi:hypothetical protein